MEQLTVNAAKLYEYRPYLRLRVERGGLLLKTLESWSTQSSVSWTLWRADGTLGVDGASRSLLNPRCVAER